MIRSLAIAVSAFVALSGELQANDLYVKAGAADGDGTKAKPFGDIQDAVDKAVSGDVIHVVQGRYQGAFDVGWIVIDKPGLTLAGGYKDETFAERNPFLYPTFIIEKEGVMNGEGGYVRGKGGGGTIPESITIDGFWFDRKGQNGYDEKWNIQPPPILMRNIKPIIVLEQPDCHVRNCVFANSGFYAVRVLGDGSSVENNLFVNCNAFVIESFSKNRKIGKGYPFHKIKISHNTFVGIRNAYEGGRAISHDGGVPGAHLEVTDNIFHLAGTSSSVAYALTDLKNFKRDRWVTFSRNSISKFPKNVFYHFYSKDLTKTVALSKLADLAKAPVAEAKENDEEDPGFELDKEWAGAYDSIICQPYPIDHVKTGALFAPKNEKVKARGLQAAGPFPIVKGSLLPASTPDGGDGKEANLADFKEVDWNTLWTTGEGMVGKQIKVKCYWCGGGNVASGSGKSAVPYLAGASDKTHRVLKLRDLGPLVSGQTLMGFIRLGSSATNYIDKEANRPGPDGKDSECNQSFYVYATVRAAGAKLFGTGPQIVLEVETIKAE